MRENLEKNLIFLWRPINRVGLHCQNESQPERILEALKATISCVLKVRFTEPKKCLSLEFSLNKPSSIREKTILAESLRSTLKVYDPKIEGIRSYCVLTF